MNKSNQIIQLVRHDPPGASRQTAVSTDAAQTPDSGLKKVQAFTWCNVS